MLGPALGLSEIRLLGWTFHTALSVLHAMSVPALDTDLLLSHVPAEVHPGRQQVVA